MAGELPEITSLASESSSEASYDNHPIARVNDHVVRISVMTQPYPGTSIRMLTVRPVDGARYPAGGRRSRCSSASTRSDAIRHGQGRAKRR